MWSLTRFNNVPVKKKKNWPSYATKARAYESSVLQDEIETLLKENEDLKSKNLSLEMQLKTALEPSMILVPQSETSTVDLSALEESANKLRAANDLYRKVKQDLERLKEVRMGLF